MALRKVDTMEQIIDIRSAEVKETKLNEISGGNFVQDIDNVEFFQPAPDPMEDTPWMEDLKNHFSWI